MATHATIAVLGAAGLIGKKHLKHIAENPRAQLHSIVDPTVEGQELGTRLNVPVFKSIEEFVATFPESKPQAAVIATPTHLHVTQATQLLQHGIHVLIEKPICADVESGVRLMRSAAQPHCGTVLAGYHRRFNPYVCALKRMLDSGKLGRILAVQGTWAQRKPDEYFTTASWRTVKGAGGALLTNMSHEIDLFRYLFGEITRVYLELGKNTRDYDVDETGAITLRFATGAVGTFIISDAAPSPFTFEGATGENPNLIPQTGANVYRILGTAGSIELPSLKRTFYAGQGNGDWSQALSVEETKDSGIAEEDLEYSMADAPFARRLVHWLDVIQNGASPNCSVEDGVMATVILNALLRSGQIGRPVDIEELS